MIFLIFNNDLLTDSTKCSSNDPICFKSKIMDKSSFMMGYFGRYTYITWYYEDVDNISDNETSSMTTEVQNEEESTDYDYYDELELEISNEHPTNRVKRSLELVKEHPPEGTYYPLPNDDETITVPSMPSTTAIPTIPQPPTMSASEPKIMPTEPTKYDVTTKFPDVEVLETTTEDYGDVGEPNCNYDPFTFILKCGLNLITSIFGLSDTCCKLPSI